MLERSHLLYGRITELVHGLPMILYHDVVLGVGVPKLLLCKLPRKVENVVQEVLGGELALHVALADDVCANLVGKVGGVHFGEPVECKLVGRAGALVSKQNTKDVSRSTYSSFVISLSKAGSGSTFCMPSRPRDIRMASFSISTTDLNSWPKTTQSTARRVRILGQRRQG